MWKVYRLWLLYYLYVLYFICMFFVKWMNEVKSFLEKVMISDYVL